jgi:uncharacterized protein YkwD
MNARHIQATMLLLAIWLAFTATSVYAQENTDIGSQTATLLFEEADAVYHTNLARQQAGAPPLRWNAELTTAARWFSWDSVVNRPEGYCGHQDTQGNWPDVRTQNAGYRGVSGAENAFCGFVSGEAAVDGWLASEGHRANLLDPNSREIGLGYYQLLTGGRGYATQDFGHDPAYAPVVINNEAISTESNQVDLFIYDAEPSGGFTGRSTTVAMQVSNNSTFAGATWEPYASRITWTLTPGDAGWRTVYVKTRDRHGRTATVQDSIYFGGAVPATEALDMMPLSIVQQDVTLYDLETNNLPMMQFSLGWLADDTQDTFHKWWGDGEQVDDAQAWGGTAYTLKAGNGETFAWIADTTFVKDTPLVAYFRIKVASNCSGDELARLSVKGGGVEYGPVILRGSDFAQAGEYQEFAVPFTYHNNPDDLFLLFQIWRSGATDVTFDAVTIFTAPQPVASTVNWQPPTGSYRGQGVWVRYTDGAANSSPLTEASTARSTLAVEPGAIDFLVLRPFAPTPVHIAVSAPGGVDWQAHSTVAWLHLEQADDSLTVSADPVELATGVHTAEITITPDGASGLAQQIIPVTIQVADAISMVYLPSVSANLVQR